MHINSRRDIQRRYLKPWFWSLEESCTWLGLSIYLKSIRLPVDILIEYPVTRNQFYEPGNRPLTVTRILGYPLTAQHVAFYDNWNWT